jgi:hypothetical protein
MGMLWSMMDGFLTTFQLHMWTMDIERNSAKNKDNTQKSPAQKIARCRIILTRHCLNLDTF